MTLWRVLTVAGVVAALLALGHPAAAPAKKRAAKICVSEANEAKAAGDSGEEAPLKFSEAFYKQLYTLDVSLDGADGRELPISIEEICGVPRKLEKQAAQLAGGDGITLLLQRTKIWQDGTLLTGTGATTALEGADTATMKVRLKRPPTWGEDEDGNRIPTFRAGWVKITD